jgi:hypothetical protein
MQRLLFDGWINQCIGQLFIPKENAYCAVGWLYAKITGHDPVAHDEMKNTIYRDVADHPEVAPIIQYIKATEMRYSHLHEYNLLWVLGDYGVTPSQFLEYEKKAKGL